MAIAVNEEEEVVEPFPRSLVDAALGEELLEWGLLS